MAGASGVPAGLSEVTPQWVGDVLGMRVDDVEVEPIGAAAGFIGQLARVHVTSDGGGGVLDDGPTSVIVKLPSADAAALEIAAAYRFYEREGGFYRHLATGPAGCGVPVPRCYATIGDGNDVALVLEDLHDLRVGDQVAGASMTDARRALRTAADLHSAWWEHPDLPAMDWLPKGSDPVYKIAAVNYPLAWPFFVQGYGDLLTPEQLRVGEGLIDSVDRFVAEAGDPPLTINHGDFRLDNLFFSANDDAPCTVIDWQIASRSRTGCFDVAYFLSGNLDPSELETSFEPLLRTYHDRLVERGVEGFSFADLEHEMRRAALGCLAYPVLGATVLGQDDPRAVALFTRMIRGYFGLAVTLDAGSVL